jgi:hypothetical protein
MNPLAWSKDCFNARRMQQVTDSGIKTRIFGIASWIFVALIRENARVYVRTTSEGVGNM